MTIENTSQVPPISIYVASSWRNLTQPRVVKLLRDEGHDVYDFKNPAAGNNGFHWSEIDGGWQTWDAPTYAKALKHPIAQAGYKSDMDALNAADICVLVLPSGRSASWECGHHYGNTEVPFIVYMPESVEPELMYAAGIIVSTEEELIAEVAKLAKRVRSGEWVIDFDGEDITQPGVKV